MSDIFESLKGQRKKRMEVDIGWLLLRYPFTQYNCCSLSLYSFTVPFQLSLTRRVSAMDVVMYTFPPFVPVGVHSLNVILMILTTGDVPEVDI